jgi:hypothetical protein
VFCAGRFGIASQPPPLAPRAKGVVEKGFAPISNTGDKHEKTPQFQTPHPRQRRHHVGHFHTINLTEIWHFLTINLTLSYH